MLWQSIGHGLGAESVGHYAYLSGTDSCIHNMRLADEVRVYLTGLNIRRWIHNRNLLFHLFLKFPWSSFGELLTFMKHHHMIATFRFVKIGSCE